MIRQFTPNWFAVTMGTGAISMALAQTPLAAVGHVFWVFNIVLFVAFSVAYVMRWILFFNDSRTIFDHPVASMFFGCIPMSIATILNGFLIYGQPHLGPLAIVIAQILWWIDIILAVLCGIAIPYMMFTRQPHTVDQMTAVWLLPVVAAEVAAASGAMLAPHLLDTSTQLVVLWLSYVLWAMSVPIAMTIIVVLFLRLAVHKLPHASMAASSWLALGPIATGALGLMLLGRVAPEILTHNELGAFASTAGGIGIIGGIMLWGYGLWWFAIATLITIRYLGEGIPFNLGWWGYTFPIGVFALATREMANVLPIDVIATLANALIALLSVAWTIVMTRTVRAVWRGDLFITGPERNAAPK